MCLGVPGEVVDVFDDGPLRMGRVRFGAIVKEVCLAHVPEATPGAYVLVHVGFALSLLEHGEAARMTDAVARLLDPDAGDRPSDATG